MNPRMKYGIATVLVCLLLCMHTAICRATLPDSLFAKHIQPQEKVYLHLDNNCYCQGDTIWYKAYVLRADSYEPHPLSRILYVELMDEQGYLVERQQLVVNDEGQTHGQFAVPDSAFAGFYEIRAYTKWMLNFGYDHEQILPKEIVARLIGKDEDERRQNRNYHGLFSRVFPVYERPKANQAYLDKLMPLKVTLGDYERRYLDPTLSIKFYPEGGNIVAGKPCRVAWEAVNQEGKRINVSGTLMSGDSAVAALPESRDGRGVMQYTFDADTRYRVETIYNGQTFSFDLPQVQREGVVMRVETYADAVNIHAESQFATPRQLYLSVTNAGRKVSVTPILEPDNIMSLTDLPCGVCQATIFDEQGRIYADRLFFVNTLDELTSHAIVGLDTAQRYKPYEKIRIPLMLTDHHGRPLREQSVSVSVRDAAQIDPTFATGNILTNMLLESEIRGFIENPDYFFEANDARHRDDLDLLLMVQGWRRYDWHEVAGLKTPVIDYEPEQKMIIRGETYTLRKKVLRKSWGKIMLTAQIVYEDSAYKDFIDAGQYGKLHTDAEGKFRIIYEPFYGKAQLILRALFDFKKKNGPYYKQYRDVPLSYYAQFDYYNHDKALFVRREYFYPLCVKQLSWYETNKPYIMPKGSLTWEDYKRGIYATEWIPEVEVKGERQHLKHRKDMPVQVIDFYDFFNDLVDIGYYQRAYMFDNNEINLEFYFPAIYAYMQHQNPRSRINKEKGEVTIDWEDPLTDLSPPGSWEPRYIKDVKDHLYEMDKLYLVTDNSRRPSAYELHHLDGRAEGVRRNGLSSYINIATGQFRSNLTGRVYNLPGFNRAAEFYNPDYSHATPPDTTYAADHRRTLYWNPDVVTDKYGQAYIEFYGSSVSKALDVSVEGVTKYGEFIVKAR